MPLWLEQFINEQPWVFWTPVALCAAGAAALWGWQSRRAKGNARVRRPVRVGWSGATAIVVVVLIAIGVAGYFIDLWADVWAFVNERPTLVAWWVAAIGGAVVLWGVAVHAWRAEARLSRQCRQCGYDMTGAPGVMTCPECGRVAKNEKQLRPRNVRRGAMWVGGALMLLAVLTPTILATAKRGLPAALPTRTLVWWLSKTASVPQPVLDETVWRCEHDQPSVAKAVAANVDGLAARWLEDDGLSVKMYEMLLEQREIPKARQEDARRALTDPSSIKRASAVRLLASASNPIELAPGTVAALAKDRSRQVAVYAQTLQYSQAAAAMHRLGQVGTGAAALDTESVRTYLRVFAATGSPMQIVLTPTVRSYVNHPDREIALLATCVIGVQQTWDLKPDLNAVVAMMRAKEELDRAPYRPAPVWASLGWNCMYNWRWDFARPLIAHPDADVRQLAFTQMLPSRAIPQGQSWAPSMGIWRSLLDDLQAQLDKETDAEAKAALLRLITEIKTEKPAPAVR